MEYRITVMHNGCSTVVSSGDVNTSGPDFENLFTTVSNMIADYEEMLTPTIVKLTFIERTL